MIQGPLVFFDLETSGTDNEKHEIIQIAADVFLAGKSISKFERKLKFDISKADPEALKVNNYDEEVWLKEAVEPIDGLKDFSKFIDPFRRRRKISNKSGKDYFLSILAGYNIARFDMQFLNNAYKNNGDLFKPYDMSLYVDVYHIVSELLIMIGKDKESFSMKLIESCKRFGILIENAHDAMFDATACAELYYECCKVRKMFLNENKINTQIEDGEWNLNL